MTSTTAVWLAIVSSVLAAHTIPILSRLMDNRSLIAGGIAPCA